MAGRGEHRSGGTARTEIEPPGFDHRYSAVRRLKVSLGGREMTPDQIAIVQESFQKVAAIADQAAEIFDRNLFELDPRLKRLFHSDMQEQGRKLMHIIGVAVHGLKNPETLLPAVQALGRRHGEYGVEAKDYETVGKALLLTLKQGLGADFTPQVREAWSATYELLSTVMKQAAYSKPQAA
jgi:hemoglobin-like flavoprotein